MASIASNNNNVLVSGSDVMFTLGNAANPVSFSQVLVNLSQFQASTITVQQNTIQRVSVLESLVSSQGAQIVTQNSQMVAQGLQFSAQVASVSGLLAVEQSRAMAMEALLSTAIVARVSVETSRATSGRPTCVVFL